MDTNNTLHDSQLHFKDISHLFAQLPSADVEQFYQGYQLWQRQQHIVLLEAQIAALTQQIAENDAYMQQSQPSPIALAALVQLQASGVEDIDLLERMLERGERWLDHTIQLLERCKQLGVIRGNYTEWCQHALDGAYEWIASMSESVDILDAVEQEDNANPAAAGATDTGEQSDVELKQATEELLLQKLMSDSDTVPTEPPYEDNIATVADEATPLATTLAVPASETESDPDTTESSAEVSPLAASAATVDMTTSTDETGGEVTDTTAPTESSDVTIPDSMQTPIPAEDIDQSDLAEAASNGTSPSDTAEIPMLASDFGPFDLTDADPMLSDTAEIPVLTGDLDALDLVDEEQEDDEDDDYYTPRSESAELPVITDNFDPLNFGDDDDDDTISSDTAKLPIITGKLDTSGPTETNVDDTSLSDTAEIPMLTDSIDLLDLADTDTDDTTILDVVTPPSTLADNIDLPDPIEADADDTTILDVVTSSTLADNTDQSDLVETDVNTATVPDSADDTILATTTDLPDSTEADADDTILAAPTDLPDSTETRATDNAPDEKIGAVEHEADFTDEEMPAAVLAAPDSAGEADEVAAQTMQAEDTANATVEALDTPPALEDITEHPTTLEQTQVDDTITEHPTTLEQTQVDDTITEHPTTLEQTQVDEFYSEIPAQDADAQVIPWSTADMLEITEKISTIYPSSNQQELHAEPTPTAMPEADAASTITPPATEENADADNKTIAPPPEIRWRTEEAPQVLQTTEKPKKRRRFFLWRLLAIILRQ